MRTDQQRKAIEVYCKALADSLNIAGFDKVKVLQHKAVPVAWSQESVKDDLFKELMQAMCYDKDGEPKTSTTQLTTTEVNKVYEYLNRWTAQNFGISIEFPNDETRQI